MSKIALGRSAPAGCTLSASHSGDSESGDREATGRRAGGGCLRLEQEPRQTVPAKFKFATGELCKPKVRPGEFGQQCANLFCGRDHDGGAMLHADCEYRVWSDPFRCGEDLRPEPANGSSVFCSRACWEKVHAR
jgi:hypothetical protein